MPSERKSKKKILLLCPHPVGYVPGQRLKYEQYLDAFRENGFDVKVSSFMSESFQKIVYTKGNYFKKFSWTIAGYCKRMFELFVIPRYDIVYVFLWVTPFGAPVFERLVRGLSKKMIYDIDDMIYLQDHKSKANPLISKLKGKTKPLYMFRTADCVITSTDTIEAYAKKLNDRVVNIPVTINTDVYIPRSGYAVEKKLIIGWSGSYSTSPYLHLLDEVLVRLAKEIDFKLLVMGDEKFELPGVETEAIVWKEEYEVPVIRQFDIGLYPLPQDEWVLGKGGGKALQYMALGVPTVATISKPNLKIITNNKDGFLVNSPEQWLEALKMLARDQQLRERIGREATKTIEEKFSVNTNKQRYLEILNSI